MVTFRHGETNITLACQNRCVSCNHFIPVQPAWFADPAVIERDLGNAAKVMHFQRYNLVGGEPTLHPALMDIIQIVKRSGIANEIEITTNGQGYKRWPDALYQELDELIVTPYKLSEDDRMHITGKCADYGLPLQWHPVAFTWAAYKQPADEQTAYWRYKYCWYAQNRNVIDEGYFYRCCIGRFIPEILLGLPRTDDAIALEGLTESALTEFMQQAKTPAGCFVCASNSGAQIPWKEQPDRAKWFEESIG